MRVVDPQARPRPFIGRRTHARLRHDYATWHEDHRNDALAASTKLLPFEDRSKFDSFQIIKEAIDRSVEYSAIIEDGKNRNFVVVFDMGYEVGFDARAKRRTSSVTVVLSPVGEVITVHPGTPWSRDWSEV